MSSPTRVLVVGAGTRVLEAALPALFSRPDAFEVVRTVARKKRTERVGERGVSVEPLDDLTSADLAGVDLVYAAVAKPAAPRVLAKLAELGATRCDLLIDTPVFLFKHLGHAKLLDGFRNAWVAEDCVALPCFDPLAELRRSGAIGEPREVVFDRSAYGYHGVAMVKALLGAATVTSASKKPAPGGAVRTLRCPGGKRGTILEPRDYARGRFHLVGTSGAVADHDEGPDGALRLEPIEESGRCVGFRAGDASARMDEVEVELLHDDPDPGGVVPRMDGLKRVGFLRLALGIREGRGAYPTAEALEDMVVDYALEKFKRWRRTPLVDPKRGVGRLLPGLLTRIAGR